jgi:hypothetical protein
MVLRGCSRRVFNGRMSHERSWEGKAAVIAIRSNARFRLESGSVRRVSSCFAVHWDRFEGNDTGTVVAGKDCGWLVGRGRYQTGLQITANMELPSGFGKVDHSAANETTFEQRIAASKRQDVRLLSSVTKRSKL